VLLVLAAVWMIPKSGFRPEGVPIVPSSPQPSYDPTSDDPGPAPAPHNISSSPAAPSPAAPSPAAPPAAPSPSPPMRDPRQLVSMVVSPPRGNVAASGVSMPCFGPVAVPTGAKSLVGFQPIANMDVVHHMVTFGSNIRDTTCWMRNNAIIYSWARTGQTSPIPLDLPQGIGFPIGPKPLGNIEWIWINVHYQNPDGAPVPDTSGVNLTFSMEPPVHPVQIALMQTADIHIPPKLPSYKQCATCDVTTGGMVYGFRNHAHRLARDIYSDVLRRGIQVQQLGYLSAQEPQIYRLFEPYELKAGDELLTHCMYNSMDFRSPTTYGADERDHEMCNQYLLMDTSVTVSNCWNTLTEDSCTAAEGVNKYKYQAAITEQITSTGAARQGIALGQLSGVAVDSTQQEFFVFNRRDKNFWNQDVIAGDTIIRFNKGGAAIESYGSGVFVVPHSLTFATLDEPGGVPRRVLWATDTTLHQVLLLAAEQGEVLLQLGQARTPGAGPTHFNKPTGVAVTAAGDLWISDGYGNSRVVLYSKHGHLDYRYTREFGSYGTGPGQFRTPHGLTLDPAGNVYVADRNNGRIQVFDSQGALLQVWEPNIKQLQGNPSTIWYGYVCDVSYDSSLGVIWALVGRQVWMYDLHGKVIQKMTPGGGSTFNFPHAIVASPFMTGNTMLVADLNNHEAKIFLTLH